MVLGTKELGATIGAVEACGEEGWVIGSAEGWLAAKAGGAVIGEVGRVDPPEAIPSRIRRMSYKALNWLFKISVFLSKLYTSDG